MKQIDELLNRVKNKKLLAIFPHPDDETFAVGGLLLTAHKHGFHTTVVILTKGGAGQMHIHPKGRTVKQVRISELQKAARILKIDDLLINDYDDGKLKRDKMHIHKFVEKIINEVQPGVIISFDHSGWTGHPDHIISSVIVRHCAYEYGKAVLLWPVAPMSLKSGMVNSDVVDFMPEPEYELRLQKTWIKKWRAASCYKSQRFSTIKIAPLFRMMRSNKYEWFHIVNFEDQYPYKYVEFEI